MGQRVDIPIGEIEKRQFFDFERMMQPKADEIYKAGGYQIVRNGDKTKDVTLIKDEVIRTIEEKFRQGSYTDILIEVVQDMITAAPGWYHTTRCDYLHYFFCDNEYHILEMIRLPWKMFKAWMLSEYLPTHKRGQYIISPRGWGLTLNILVRISDIPANMIQRFRFD